MMPADITEIECCTPNVIGKHAAHVACAKARGQGCLAQHSQHQAALRITLMAHVRGVVCFCSENDVEVDGGGGVNARGHIKRHEITLYRVSVACVQGAFCAAG